MAVRWRIVLAVAVGGVFGGLVRGAIVQAWPTAADRFPWPIFAVNTAGGLVLGALLVVVLESLSTSVYARPLLATGFCGALTTFSSVTVGVDRLASTDHVAAAIAYAAGSLVAGVVAAGFGIVGARLVVRRRKARG